MKKDVTIVGGGVTGLTNAIKIAQCGYSVRVLFNLLMEKITSWAAAAFWLPVLSGNDPRIPTMAAESLQEFNKLARNPATGVRPIRLWVAYTSSIGADLSWLRAVPTRRLEESELPEDCCFGFEANVFRMQMEDYLPFLEEQARRLGVAFEQKHVLDLAQLDADVVVNCTGVFAHHVANDPKVVPIRGQVVLVETPAQLKNPRTRDFDVLIIEGPERLDYIVFRDNDVLLGGTADLNDWNMAVDPDQTKVIIKNCARVFPALASARIVGERVGLRPFRPIIRMEIEQTQKGPIVVHNYGHGGSGVTLSWGYATLVQSVVQQQFANLEAAA